MSRTSKDRFCRRESCWPKLLIAATCLGAVTCADANTILPERHGLPVTAEMVVANAQLPDGGRCHVGGFLEGDKIVFAGPGPDGRSQLQTLDVVSGARIAWGHGEFPVVSSDGRRIAFITETSDPGAGAPMPQIWITDSHGGRSRLVAGGGAERLGDAQSIELAWSPDGERLAYKFRAPAVSKPGSSQTTASVVVTGRTLVRAHSPRGATEVHIVSLADGRDTRAFSTDADQIFGLVWDKNGENIITNTASQDTESPVYRLTTKIISIGIDNGNIRTLLSGHSLQADQKPSLSPDGTHLLFLDVDPRFTSYYPTSHRLAILNLADSSITKLDNGSQPLGTVRWSSSGRTFSYLSRRDSRTVLVKGDIATGNTAIADDLTPEDPVDQPIRNQRGDIEAWVSVVHPLERTLLHVKERRAGERNFMLCDPSENIATGAVEFLTWKSSDGLDIHGFLIYPLGFNPTKKYPLLVSLHGGPEISWPEGAVMGPALVRSPLEWHYWAARGYLVLQADYRASQFYGDEAILDVRSNGGLFERDANDILTGVMAVEAKGVVDPNRIGLIGHSWGSYEVNWLIGHSRIFKAAVSYEGGDVLLDWGAYGRPLTAFEWYLKDKPPFSAWEAYRRESAIFNVAGVKTPTLFISTDGGIHSPAQAWLTAALLRQGVAAELVHYTNEGHLIARPENQRDLLQRVTKWFDDELRLSP